MKKYFVTIITMSVIVMPLFLNAFEALQLQNPGYRPYATEEPSKDELIRSEKRDTKINALAGHSFIGPTNESPLSNLPTTTQTQSQIRKEISRYESQSTRDYSQRSLHNAPPPQ